MSTRTFGFIIWALAVISFASLVQAIIPIEPCVFETCRCTKDSDSGPMTIDCENENHLAPAGYFPKRNASVTTLNVDMFIVFSYNFKQIPDNTFEGLTISQLFLINNSLSVLTKNSLKGIVSLRGLTISEEDDFNTIEAGAFDPIAATLTKLEMSSLKIDDSKFNSFSSEIQKLKPLGSITLDDNQITTIGPDQFKGFLALEYFYINKNRLSNVDSTAFLNDTNLKYFSASRNKLTNLKDLVDALKPASRLLSTIDASKNEIKSLAFKSDLEYLRNLRLADNQIASFDNQSLVGSNELLEIDLTNNNLSFIDDFRLRDLEMLSSLSLSNNHLSEVPSIIKTQIMSSFDISSQNGKLKSIQDYAFETESSPTYALRLNLGGNDIDTFGQKSFCSRYYVPSLIKPVIFSYKTMKAIPKCVLKQLSLKPSTILTEVVVEKPTDGTTNYTDVCNCDLLSFSRIYGINITGVCQSVFNTLDCNSTAYKDPCVNQTQFDCIASLSSTTTVTSPASTSSSVTRTTTTASSSKRLAAYSPTGYFFLYIISFWITKRILSSKIDA